MIFQCIHIRYLVDVLWFCIGYCWSLFGGSNTVHFWSSIFSLIDWLYEWCRLLRCTYRLVLLDLYSRSSILSVFVALRKTTVFRNALWMCCASNEFCFLALLSFALLRSIFYKCGYVANMSSAYVSMWFHCAGFHSFLFQAFLIDVSYHR